MSVVTRFASIDDVQALKNIWETVFGDSEEEIDTFFDHYFSEERCCVATLEDIPVSAGYVLPVGHLINGSSRIPCSMIYALATLPEYERQGYGTAVVRELLSRGRTAGCECVVLRPSSDSLFDYYRSHTTLRDFFYYSEQYFSAAPESRNALGLTAVSGIEYGLLREKLLSGIPHIEFDITALSYQSRLSARFGGGLFRIDADGGLSCAAIEKQQDGVIHIKELLVQGNIEADVIAAIASSFPSSDYLVRTLASHASGSVQARKFGMLADIGGIINIPPTFSNSPFFGLAFD